MKMRRMHSFFLLLLLLAIAIPILTYAEDEAMIVQEIAVSNTPIKGTIEIDKWGFVLKGFSENRDTLGYTVHTPLYQEDWLPGTVYEVRAREDIVGRDQKMCIRDSSCTIALPYADHAASRSNRRHRERHRNRTVAGNRVVSSGGHGNRCFGIIFPCSQYTRSPADRFSLPGCSVCCRFRH